jgi:hypothetical protein
VPAASLASTLVTTPARPSLHLLRRRSSDLQARVGAMLFGQREPVLVGLQSQLFSMMTEELQRETTARTPRPSSLSSVQNFGPSCLSGLRCPRFIPL